MPRRRPAKPSPKRGPARIRPEDAAADIFERIAPRRQLRLEDGDVVLVKEPVPRLNPASLIPEVWRYRVATYPNLGAGAIFNSFQHAASEGEQVASHRGARLMFVEQSQPVVVLADYRPAKP